MVLRVISKIPKSKVLFWVSLFGGIASILSFLGQFFVGKDWKVQYIAVSSMVYILVLLAVCIYMLVDRGNLLRNREAERSKLQTSLDSALKQARYTEVFALLHSIYHKLRNTLFGLDTNPPEPIDYFDEAFCTYILDVFREAFQKITRADCCACIKAFDGNEEDLKTIARDSIGAAVRGSEDSMRPSRVSGNKDFSDIVQRERKYYFCNNLIREEEAGKYYNDNPRWKERYRSTIIWPIRCQDRTSGKYLLFGFLCVDSMATGIFDEQVDMEIGASVADMIYTYFSRLDVLRAARRK